MTLAVLSGPWFFFVCCSCPIHCLLRLNLAAPPTALDQVVKKFLQQDVALGLREGTQLSPLTCHALGDWKICTFLFPCS